MRAGWGSVLLLLLCACSTDMRKEEGGESREWPVADLMSHVSVERPVDMQTVKTDSSFLWLSNGDAHRQRHFCLYSYAGRVLDPMQLLQKRDSVMRRHVKGASDSIWQATVRESVSYALLTSDGTKKLEMKGLWQMAGDAMGGPFVCCAVLDSARSRIVVADGFIYAPGKKKEQLMQRMEQVVKTINIK